MSAAKHTPGPYEDCLGVDSADDVVRIAYGHFLTPTTRGGRMDAANIINGVAHYQGISAAAAIAKATGAAS